MDALDRFEAHLVSLEARIESLGRSAEAKDVVVADLFTTHGVVDSQTPLNLALDALVARPSDAKRLMIALSAFVAHHANKPLDFVAECGSKSKKQFADALAAALLKEAQGTKLEYELLWYATRHRRRPPLPSLTRPTLAAALAFFCATRLKRTQH